jgi:predicted dehydrogenase
MIDSAPPLRVALAGAGMISLHHLIAWRNLGDAARVVAIYDPDPAAAHRRAEAFGIACVAADPAALLEQERIDALDIASPRETHAFWVEAAAARGIDILCQKPLTPTLAQSMALVQAVGGKVRLMVHENWRFRPWYRAIKRWIEAGEIGEILLGQMAMFTSGMLPDPTGACPALVRQPFMAHEPRLMIAESLIHQLDVVRWLIGPLRVVGARALHTQDTVRGETLATILLESASGAPVVVSGTSVAPGYPARALDRLELIGRTASAVLDGTALRLQGARHEAINFEHEQGYQASFDGVIAHFVACLRSGAAFETDPTDNLETLRLVEHAYWAAGLHG